MLCFMVKNLFIYREVLKTNIVKVRLQKINYCRIYVSSSVPRPGSCSMYRYTRRGRGGGAEYLIITKDRLVLASALYHLHESYFYHRQKHVFGISLGSKYLITTGFNHQRYMPLMPHGSTRRWSN